MIIQLCKTQIVCFIILMYIGIVYVKDGTRLNELCDSHKCNKSFDFMYIVAEIALLFDGLTAYTVNCLDTVPDILNKILHLGMFASYEVFAIFLFMYWTGKLSHRRGGPALKIIYAVPGIICIILTIMFMPGLEFVSGKYTNYSMGIAVYIAFACVAFYCLLTAVLIIMNYRSISRKKLVSLDLSLIFIVIIIALQILFPEALLTCIAVTMVILSIYINMENPAISSLEHYHHEMVMGFATLVENKDDSTGGHIKRSSAYAVIIARKLKNNKRYREIITKDYIDNLAQSAPMHDIGKIGIPDSILQKPGRLTDEEFDKMKEHPVIGGKIIEDTFGHLFDGEYESMAYQVAMYHHEKWNGKGYPEGRKGEDIPLCARIMAVADVFDAVSAKRCYRDAMPLEKCYEIIQGGKGTDFDPEIVDVFMSNKEEIENIYYNTL